MVVEYFYYYFLSQKEFIFIFEDSMGISFHKFRRIEERFTFILQSYGI